MEFVEFINRIDFLLADWTIFLKFGIAVGWRTSVVRLIQHLLGWPRNITHHNTWAIVPQPPRYLGHWKVRILFLGERTPSMVTRRPRQGTDAAMLSSPPSPEQQQRKQGNVLTRVWSLFEGIVKFVKPSKVPEEVRFSTLCVTFSVSLFLTTLMLWYWADPFQISNLEILRK